MDNGGQAFLLRYQLNLVDDGQLWARRRTGLNSPWSVMDSYGLAAGGF